MTGETAEKLIFSIATLAPFSASAPSFPEQSGTGDYDLPSAKDDSLQLFNISQVGTHGLLSDKGHFSSTFPRSVVGFEKDLQESVRLFNL